MQRARRQRGVPNAGPPRDARRAGSGVRACVLTGTLAWIERDGRLAVLRVHDTNRRARAFRGRNVTVDLSAARVSAPDRDGDGRQSVADLLPGERVSVRANVDRWLSELPRTIAARQVIAHDHAL
jgi:hypothetical protein